jgi:hypothetical protein
MMRVSVPASVARSETTWASLLPSIGSVDMMLSSISVERPAGCLSPVGNGTRAGAYGRVLMSWPGRPLCPSASASTAARISVTLSRPM